MLSTQWLIFVASVLVRADIVSASFDVNDILSVPLMPISWLMLDNPEATLNDDRSANVSARSMDDTKHDGSFDVAYSTMGFHRKMIKEYMCSNYLASNILQEVAPSHFQHRLGVIGNASDVTEENEHEDNSLVETMKFDQGSKGYKDWLSKTTTLDDIYRHYLPSNVSITKTKMNNRGNFSSRRQDKPVHEDYEEGDVTGYAMQQPIEPLGGLYSYQHSQINHYNHHQGYDIYPTADSKSVYPPFSHGQPPNEFHYHQPPAYTPNDGISLPPPSIPSEEISLKQQIWNLMNPFNLFTRHDQHETPSSHPIGYEYPSHGSDYGASHAPSSGSSKEMGLKDLFDIALTTLAFLSFGMFILQVLMCVTMSKSDNSSMMMLPMEEVPATGGGEVEGRRTRRSTIGNGSSGLSLAFMNELTKTVLMSIDAVEMADKDHGSCLRYAQCESNKMSRDLDNSQKLWIPVWNLGISWLASRVVLNQPKTSSILESLKASAYGLGRADCSKMFACSKKYKLKDRK